MAGKQRAMLLVNLTFLKKSPVVISGAARVSGAKSVGIRLLSPWLDIDRSEIDCPPEPGSDASKRWSVCRRAATEPPELVGHGTVSAGRNTPVWPPMSALQ